jgi:tetratricopeptide (TPR) repeat protein
MRKAPFVALLFAAAALLAACTSTPRTDQIKFGVWASEQGLWDEAVFRWKHALKDDPGSAAAHNNLGVAYEKKGLFEEALKEYEAALKLAPRNEYVKSNYDACKEILQPAKAGAEGTPADAKKKK